jgi:hypothetical protein
MSGKEAKETLEAISGLLYLIRFTCLTNGDSEQLSDLFDKYDEAVVVAKDAIDIMDNKLDIEKKKGE